MARLISKPRRRITSEGAAGYWLSAPLAVLMLLLVGIPTVIGAVTSLQAYSLSDFDRPFTGLDNFFEIFSDPAFYPAVRFTIVFTIFGIIGEVILGAGLALLFNRSFRGKSVFLTLALFPILTAPAFMAALWQLTLNSNSGFLGALFAEWGISQNLLGPDTAVPTIIVINILHWAPFVMVLIYSGLQTVPDELYESAMLDGAGYWKTQFYVSLPHVLPILAVALFIRLIGLFKTFDIIYVLTGGGPGTATTNINIYAYQLAFTNGEFGQSAAVSMIFLIALLVLVPLITRFLLGGKKTKAGVK